MRWIRQRYIKVQYGIAFAALGFLLVITLANSTPPLFDEILFLRNMPLFEEAGLSVRFLREMYDQAPGPLYQIVQSFFKPVTHLNTPGIRLVNVFLFFGVIANTYFILRSLRGIGDEKLLLALNLVAVPVIWQVAGMALTEMPAMFMVTLSVMMLGALLNRERKINATTVILALLGGIALGLAILGRTPYLMLLPAVAVLGYNPLAEKPERFTLPMVLVAVYGVSAAAICFPMFIIWKGLVPPHQAVIAEGGIKLWHGVLAFAYSGIIAVLLVPQWFTMSKRIAVGMIILFGLCLVLNLFWLKVEYWPFYYFLAGIFPQRVMEIYPHLISPLLMVFAAYFVFTLAIHVLKNRNDAFYLALALALVFVLMTCANIKHLFSSRYVAQAAPLMILLLAGKDTFDDFKMVRLLIGISVGYLSLQTYLNP